MQNGENIYRISLKYSIKQDELIKLNNIKNNFIKRKKKSVITNRQKLVIDSSIIKKIAIVMIFVLPIIFSFIIGGLDFFYKNIVRIAFFEVFVLMFIILNNILNKLLRNKN